MYLTIPSILITTQVAFEMLNAKMLPLTFQPLFKHCSINCYQKFMTLKFTPYCISISKRSMHLITLWSYSNVCWNNASVTVLISEECWGVVTELPRCILKYLTLYKDGMNTEKLLWQQEDQLMILYFLWWCRFHLKAWRGPVGSG